MQQDVACPAPDEQPSIRVQSLDFSVIPGQSKLFVTYQHDPRLLADYYPNSVGLHTDISSRIGEVLERHTADRGPLCDALEEMNKKFGATEKTLGHIAMLRDSDTVAVVSGQQAGLFTGPLYTIYKALSAVRMAECLRERGFKAVPVFWVATEDHDFEEVSKTFVLDTEGRETRVSNEPKRCFDELPVGYIKLDESIHQTISSLFAALAHTEYTDELRGLIESAWTPQSYFGDAFARMLTKILGNHGIIILCPLDSRLKALASPIYVEAIKRSEDIVSALQQRSNDLVKAGYPAQVHIGDDYFPLFWQARDGTRNSLKRSEQGTFRTKDGSREFTLDELAEIAEREPTRFSPSVVLRSVVQDYLLPTVCYFGGAAEVAYFAQSGEVYRLLSRLVTPIIHRQSFTLVESRHLRTLDRYGLEFEHLFAGINALLPEIVEKYLNRGTGELIIDVEQKVVAELDRLSEELASLDPTLAEYLANRRRKVIYHIESIRTKFHRAQFRRDAEARRQIEALFAALYPQGHLQERSLNVTYFLNRYGPGFLDWIYRSIELSDKGHRLLNL
ncbi:MAG TPA: bacillithiol biosynthesis cysteine-adding enzyme BshC [Pyrinomonadaceae bacterium]|nr:bacillithiol biosynthesis cysteine-adding enzyme BshC [Pyrinomonadaceae bacterium]HMP66881.1 bacillithiol biosynthesis cysteine-adding enzyme BshC [Pyrinomonadaceae bacterium]